MTTIQLYEYEPTRSARPRWALLEADIDYESVGNSPSVFANTELSQLHPLGKIPVATFNGKVLFESIAICNAIGDLVPEKQLIARPGTWSRNLHDQWILFVTTEMEAWLWPIILNTYLLPEGQRITENINQNREMFRRGATALNTYLSTSEYLIDNQFSVADIIAGYTVNAGRKFQAIDGFSHLTSYLDRLFKRTHCTLDTN